VCELCAVECGRGTTDSGRNQAVNAVLAHGHAGQADFGTYPLSRTAVSSRAGRTGDAGHTEPVVGPAFQLPGCLFRRTHRMAGRHRLKGRRQQVPQHGVPHRAIEVVDARTLLGHFLTVDAFAAGRLPDGRYIALCGEDLLPACLVEPGTGRCTDCVAVPRQRAGAS
jgi:hypothetical protein